MKKKPNKDYERGVQTGLAFSGFLVKIQAAIFDCTFQSLSCEIDRLRMLCKKHGIETQQPGVIVPLNTKGETVLTRAQVKRMARAMGGKAIR